MKSKYLNFFNAITGEESNNFKIGLSFKSHIYLE